MSDLMKQLEKRIDERSFWLSSDLRENDALTLELLKQAHSRIKQQERRISVLLDQLDIAEGDKF